MRTLVLAFVATFSMIMTQPLSARDLPLERLFASPDLAGPSPRKPKLSPDGKLVTLLRNRAEDKDRYDLWAIDTTTGAARMLVDSAKIGSSGEISEEEKMRRERQRIAGTKGITDYGWAPDGKRPRGPIAGQRSVATPEGDGRPPTATKRPGAGAKIP